MLSDEEKEALEILNNTEWDGFMITIKNLIKKQSKEIQDRDKKWEDKIKAKIEEVSNGTFDAKIVLQSLLKKGVDIWYMHKVTDKVNVVYVNKKENGV